MVQDTDLDIQYRFSPNLAPLPEPHPPRLIRHINHPRLVDRVPPTIPVPRLPTLDSVHKLLELLAIRQPPCLLGLIRISLPPSS